MCGQRGLDLVETFEMATPRVYTHLTESINDLAGFPRFPCILCSFVVGI